MKANIAFWESKCQLLSFLLFSPFTFSTYSSILLPGLPCPSLPHVFHLSMSPQHLELSSLKKTAIQFPGSQKLYVFRNGGRVTLSGQLYKCSPLCPTCHESICVCTMLPRSFINIFCLLTKLKIQLFMWVSWVSYILETVFLILGRTFYAEVTSMDTCCWLGLQDQHLKIFIIFSLMLTYLLENKIINQVPQWSFNTLNLAIDKNDLFYNLFRLCNILLQYSIKKCKKNFSNFSIRFLRQPNTVIKYYIKSI